MLDLPADVAGALVGAAVDAPVVVGLLVVVSAPWSSTSTPEDSTPANKELFSVASSRLLVISSAIPATSSAVASDNRVNKTR